MGAERLWVQHLCHDFGEASLPAHYRPMRDFVGTETLLDDDAARIEHWFGEARAVAADLELDLRLPRTQPRPHSPGTPGRKRCSWPWDQAYVSYQGLAMPCCMVSTPDRANFGNVFEHGMDTVWNDPAFAAFRARLDSNEPPDLCRSCAVYNGTF